MSSTIRCYLRSDHRLDSFEDLLLGLLLAAEEASQDSDGDDQEGSQGEDRPVGDGCRHARGAVGAISLGRPGQDLGRPLCPRWESFDVLLHLGVQAIAAYTRPP